MITMPKWAIIAAVALVNVAQAQLAARLTLDKKQYVVGEPILATMMLTNQSDKPISLFTDTRFSWLDFLVSNQRGEMMVPMGKPSFGKMTLARGATMSRTVVLNAMFSLDQLGDYRVSGVARLPGSAARDGSSTQELRFTVLNALPYWSQKIGYQGSQRDLRILKIFNGNDTDLYTQIADGNNKVRKSFKLGKIVYATQPTIVLDSQQRINLLYMATGRIWVYAVIDAAGRVVAQQYHERGAAGTPQLVQVGGGKYMVANSIPYDPRAAEKMRKEQEKASARPQF